MQNYISNPRQTIKKYNTLCKVCESEKVRNVCQKCDICIHNNIQKNCSKCNPCKHNKNKKSCSICNACEHNKHKYNCSICNICKHGSYRKKCIECKKNLIIKREKRSKKSQTNTNIICEHKLSWNFCVLCLKKDTSIQKPIINVNNGNNFISSGQMTFEEIEIERKFLDEFFSS